MFQNNIRRITALLFALSYLMISFCGVNSAHIASAETPVQKRLVQFRQTSSKGYIYITDFAYNEKGLLSSADTASFGYRYFYDEADRLTEVWHYVWGTDWGTNVPMYKYEYDDNGFLIRITGDGEGDGVNVTLENDAKGRMIRKTSVRNIRCFETTYFYNEDGSHVEAYSERGRITYDYTFDDQERILTELVNESGQNYDYTYYYNYLPFVARSENNPLPSYFAIQDSAGREIWELSIGREPQTPECDEDGYLKKVAGRSDTYEFFYEDVPSENDIAPH